MKTSHYFGRLVAAFARMFGGHAKPPVEVRDRVASMNPNLIVGTAFEKNIRSFDRQLTDHDLRQLVFKYCQLYQDVYSFEQLKNAFAFLEIVLSGDRDAVQNELPSVRTEVGWAMGEYFESLNEVATAIHRLLDDRPMTVDDALTALSHVWNAHACNEHPSEFRTREDRILCALLANIKPSS